MKNTLPTNDVGSARESSISRIASHGLEQTGMEELITAQHHGRCRAISDKIISLRNSLPEVS